MFILAAIHRPLALPDLDFTLQLDAQAFGHAGFDDADQFQHFRPLRRAGKYKIRMPVADFGLADAGAFESGLLDQHAGAYAARIAENTAGTLVAQRLARLFDDPLFLHAFGQLFGIFFFELNLGV